MNQNKPEDPVEVERRKVAEKLDEVDFLKLRLLNRNVDFFTAQIELSQMQSLEASRALMGFSNEIVERYALEDTRQVDVHTGRVARNVAPPGGVPNE